MENGIRAVVRELAEDPNDGIAAVALEAQSFPDEASLRPTDVVVRVRSAAVGWVDLLMTSGQYQHAPPLPYTPGLEYAGTIVWAGAEVRGVAVGQEVVADGLATGPRSKGDHQIYGGFATYAVAPASAVRPVWPPLTLDQAASFFASYETAYYCLVTCGELRAGETALIHGASGASGLAAVQIAKTIGATVIATGRSPDKLAVVRGEGADHVIATGGDLRAEIKAITGGRGVDVVYDAVGGELSIESLRCCAFGARFLIVGWAATPAVAKGKGGRGAPNANVLPTNLVLMKGLRVIGCPTAISTHRDPGLRDERLARLGAWVKEGALRPLVSRTYRLAEVKEAMRAKWESRHVGAIVIHP